MKMPFQNLHTILVKEVRILIDVLSNVLSLM